MVVSQEQINGINKGNSIYHGNAAETARKLGVSHSTVIKYWKAANLKPLSHGGRRISLKKEGNIGSLEERVI